jgi:hypothetical protein
MPATRKPNMMRRLRRRNCRLAASITGSVLRADSTRTSRSNPVKSRQGRVMYAVNPSRLLEMILRSLAGPRGETRSRSK